MMLDVMLKWMEMNKYWWKCMKMDYFGWNGYKNYKLMIFYENGQRLMKINKDECKFRSLFEMDEHGLSWKCSFEKFK